MISASEKRKRPERTQEPLDTIKRRGLTPDPITYSAMKCRGLAPDAITYSAPISAFEKGKQPERAHEIFETM